MHVTGQFGYAYGSVEAQRRTTEPKPDDAISELSQGNHTKGDWKDVLGTENSIERSNNLV